jgi:hypothetical protein
MIDIVPLPAADSSTMRDRHTNFCGVFRSATQPSSSARSSGESQMLCKKILRQRLLLASSIADLSSATYIAVLGRKSRGTFVKKVFSWWVCVDGVVLVSDHLAPASTTLQASGG